MNGLDLNVQGVTMKLSIRNRMMKIYIPNNSKQGIGGGWTFLRNFKKAFEKTYVYKGQAVGMTTSQLEKMQKDEIVDTWQECDLVLITGATMTHRQEMLDAQAGGKKIVFRVDNIPRDSRNRGTAFSRMLDFAKMADFIIFQSEWAKDYAGWWFEDNGVDITNKSAIIYNGVDTEAFYEKEESPVKDRYIYVQFNRDENKRMTEAFYNFHQIHRENKNAELYLVGQFSPELIQNGFDFFAGENITYLGIIDHREQLGDVFRSCEYLMFPAFADASPNTVMEAMACGCEVVGTNETGGTKELLKVEGRTIQDMANDYKLVFENICLK